MATQVVILRLRAKLCFALGEVEKCHDGNFQEAARRGSIASIAIATSASVATPDVSKA
jgi:hypothetical protein